MALLKVTNREQLGTHKAQHLRKKGFVPGIIYGHGQTPVAVAVALRDLQAVLHHHDRLLELDLDGTKENVLIKEVQLDAMQQEILHVDLARVNLDERVKVIVPILLRGTPAGAADGGVLAQVLAEVHIECLVTAIPEEIRMSVADMKLGDVIKIKDLPLPAGAAMLGDSETIVASVTLVIEEVAEPSADGETAAGGGPEVIGAKKDDAEAGEAADGKKEPKKEAK
jgi:large subunit ribosomal protein L25